MSFLFLMPGSVISTVIRILRGILGEDGAELVGEDGTSIDPE